MLCSPRVAPWLLVALSWAPSTRAQSPPWSLSWEAPEACPTESAVRAQIASLVGDSDAADPVHITARISPATPVGWRASLRTETRGALGSRTLDAPSCAELADAVAVILAWMIDPAMRARTAPPAPGASVRVTGPPPPDEVAPPATPAPSERAPEEREAVTAVAAVSPQPRPAPSRPWRVRASFGARGDLGPMPSFAVAVAARLSLVRGRWRLFAQGSWRPSQRFERAASPSAGGDFDLWTAGLGACFRWPSRRVVPTVCAGLEGGALTGVGFGITRPDTDREPWVAAAAGGGVELPLTSWLTVSARASALVPFVRPRFLIENLGEVFQPSPVALLTEIDAEVIF